MADIRLFSTQGKNAIELKGKSLEMERSLQQYIENNCIELLGVHFLSTEYTTGRTHGGRIDTIGIDENGCPVIIEYKRAINENVINQGLFYLDWLLDHKGEFELLVQKKIGPEWQDKIDWSNPRLLCIAGDFTKYDLHAIQQINRNIELIKYRKFENNLLLLELVNVISSSQPHQTIPTSDKKKGSGKTISETLDSANTETKDRYDQLRLYIEALGDDVTVKVLKLYIAFKRLKNFVCLFITAKGEFVLWLKVDPTTVPLIEGFSRDVTNIGHYGTGNLEIILRNNADFEKAKELIRKSYEEG
jgi:predicted transport protein